MMDKAPGELSSLAGDDSSLQSEHRAPRFGEEVLISSSEVPRDEEGEGLTLVIPQVSEARALFSSQGVVETTGLKDNSDDLLNLGNNDTARMRCQQRLQAPRIIIFLILATGLLLSLHA